MSGLHGSPDAWLRIHSPPGCPSIFIHAPTCPYLVVSASASGCDGMVVTCTRTRVSVKVIHSPGRPHENPVLDALKYRVFHVPGACESVKLRLFYKTRNENSDFQGIFGGIGCLRGIPGRRIGAGLVIKISAVDKKASLLREGCSRWVVRGSGGGSGRDGTPRNR